MAASENIHPIFDRVLSKQDKEKFLNQHARVIWLTGLSGSGKSTIAVGLERKLIENNFFNQTLDGDNIRSGINSNLGFTDEDRVENIRRIAEISKLFINSGIITINSFVSPTKKIRDLAKKIIGKENFIEIYVNASVEACEKRDVKGLYKKAKKGEIKNFTGIDSTFEPPLKPDLGINTEQLSIEASVDKLYQFILPKILYNNI